MKLSVTAVTVRAIVIDDSTTGPVAVQISSVGQFVLAGIANSTRSTMPVEADNATRFGETVITLCAHILTIAIDIRIGWRFTAKVTAQTRSAFPLSLFTGPIEAVFTFTIFAISSIDSKFTAAFALPAIEIHVFVGLGALR